MCVYIYVCVYVNIYTYMYMCVFIYIYIDLHGAAFCIQPFAAGYLCTALHADTVDLYLYICKCPSNKFE